jgi:ribose-phosphate pyrophosphokinase
LILMGNTKVTFTTFPNGETKVNEEQIKELMYKSSFVTLKYETDADLIKLMFLKKYLDEQKLKVDLLIAYMPYSRMDRSENGSAFTLKYITQFINQLNFEHINVLEPHSEVTMALLDRATAEYPTLDLLGKVMSIIGFNYDEDIVFFPDAGAQKRYTKYLKDTPSAVGIKTRDFESGNIDKLMLAGLEDAPRNVIIIDDLCSRGGTFMMAGTALREAGAQKIYLLTTHCEHNIMTGDIFTTDVIDGVFTTNTIVDHSLHAKMTVFSVIGGANGSQSE